MRRSVLTLCAAGLLAGCASETMTFASKQEEACYRQVSANLPGDRQLRRDGAGRFVEVLIINDQVRDIDVSPEFDSCMARGAGGAAISEMGTLTLTAAEQRTWSTLTEPEKRDALEFAADGGSFAQWLAQR